MNFAAFVLGLIYGLLRKGRLASIFKKHFRWSIMLFLSLLLDLLRANSILLDNFGDADWYPVLRILLAILQYALMLAFLFRNHAKPGMGSLIAGTLMNGLVIISNSGMMPVGEAVKNFGDKVIENLALLPHYFLASGSEPLLFLADNIPFWFFGWIMISLGDLLILLGAFRLGSYMPKRIVRPRPKMMVEHPDDFGYTVGR